MTSAPIVGNSQMILSKQVRPHPIHLLNIIIVILIIYWVIKWYVLKLHYWTDDHPVQRKAEVYVSAQSCHLIIIPFQ